MELKQLYIELDAVEAAMEGAMFRQERKDLNTRRAALLGQIKSIERGNDERQRTDS
jgi:hypothetical protein